MVYLGEVISKLRGQKSSALVALLTITLAPLGFEPKSKRAPPHDWSDVTSFIPFERTLEAARNAGLPIGDYIDSVMNLHPDVTRATIEKIAKLGVFEGDIKTILEIGPGSGRYLDATIAACRSAQVEIYETAPEWAAYVSKEYGALLRPTDGRTLASTPAASIDLAQAYKVFSSVPFIVTTGYWLEMCRVVRPGGFVVFDIMTETTLNPALFEKWASARSGMASSYPAVMPRQAVVSFFESHAFSLIDSFPMPMGPGETEIFVFKKRAEEV